MKTLVPKSVPAVGNEKSELDWSDLRVFLHVAQGGTVRASEQLKMDITTVRRRVAALEKAVGLRLLVRNGRSFRLTADGEHVRAVAAEMEEVGRELRRERTDTARTLEGVVRISTMDGFGSAYLAPQLAVFAARHPKISIQLVTAPHILNLSEREADLSINMMSPQRGRLVVRKLAQFGVGLYGSPPYLDGNGGSPLSLDDLPQHSFVTYVDELISVPHVRWLPDVLASPKSRFGCTSLHAQLEAARGGAGLAMLPHFMASRTPGLVRVLDREVNLVRDWWLVVHQDLQTVPRIRAAIDFIAKAMSADSALLMGYDPKTPVQ